VRYIGRCFGFIALLLLVACASPTAAAREVPVPAQEEAERLRTQEPPAAAEVRDLRAQELAAQTAAAQAVAAGNPAQAEHQCRLGEELGRMRAAAEAREREQRQQMEALAADADRRAVAERAEMDQRAAAAQQEADRRQAEARRRADQRWAGWGLALAVAAGIALRLLGMPALISGGIPVAVGAGCLTLAAWSSVPWLAPLLGICLAGSLVVLLAVVVRRLVVEWTDYAQRLGAVHPSGKADADAASLERQPAWMRWVVDYVLAQQGGRQCHRSMQRRCPRWVS
jgi:hypothetical protein